MRIVSRFAREQRLTPTELTEDAVVLTRRKLEGIATREHAEALKNYADEEQHRIDIRLKERTLETKVRQEEATADKLESDVRLAKIKEADALIDLLGKLRQYGVVITMNSQNNINVSNAPTDFDWQSFMKSVIAEHENSTNKRLPPI